MISCDKCGNKIINEMALYCPYCGRQIPEDGGVPSATFLNDFSRKIKRSNDTIAVRTGESSSVDYVISKALLSGDRLVCSSEQRLLVFRLSDDSSGGRLSPLANLSCDSGMFCILRPYLVYIDDDRVNWCRLEQPELTDFRPSVMEISSIRGYADKIMLPFSRNVGGKRASAIILVDGNRLHLTKFDEHHLFAGEANLQLGLKGPVTFVHIDSDGELMLFSAQNECVTVSLIDWMGMGLGYELENQPQEIGIGGGFKVVWGCRHRRRELFLYMNSNNEAKIVVDRNPSSATDAFQSRNQKPLFDPLSGRVFLMGQQNNIGVYEFVTSTFTGYKSGYRPMLSYDNNRLSLSLERMFVFDGKLLALLPLELGSADHQRVTLCSVRLASGFYTFEPIYAVPVGGKKLPEEITNLQVMYSNGRIVSFLDDRIIRLTLGSE